MITSLQNSQVKNIIKLNQKAKARKDQRLFIAYIAGFEKDLETLAAHQPPEGEFAGMFIRGDTLTDKDNAGAAILDRIGNSDLIFPTPF